MQSSPQFNFGIFPSFQKQTTCPNAVILCSYPQAWETANLFFIDLPFLNLSCRWYHTIICGLWFLASFDNTALRFIHVVAYISTLFLPLKSSLTGTLKLLCSHTFAITPNLQTLTIALEYPTG